MSNEKLQAEYQMKLNELMKMEALMNAKGINCGMSDLSKTSSRYFQPGEGDHKDLVASNQIFRADVVNPTF